MKIGKLSVNPSQMSWRKAHHIVSADKPHINISVVASDDLEQPFLFGKIEVEDGLVLIC